MVERDRISRAIERIEVAVDRIYTASEKISVQSLDNGSWSAKHEILRKEVSATLSDLDHLIAGLEP